jgi:hypothetical protein
MSHHQVVDASGGDKFVVIAQCGGGGDVVERQVEVEDGVGVDVEGLGDDAEYEVVALGGVVDAGDDRQHIFLFREAVAFVDAAVEVDCKMGNGEQRSFDADVAVDGAQGVVAAQYYATGY